MILVLVDVDNLIGRLSSRPDAGALDPGDLLPIFRGSSRSTSPIQLCLTMNLKSAAMFPDWNAVQTLASGLAKKIAPRSREVRPAEVALCLSVPEAADRALMRLFVEAPTTHEEAVEEVWLLSWDGGLQRTMERGVAAVWPRCFAERMDGGRCWRLPVASKRSAPEPPVVLGEVALGLPGVTALLDESARCVAVAQRRVQCPTDWSELLDVLARNPWVLSQVGVTFHDGNGRGDGSVRGVARLRDCLSMRGEVLLECAPQDGVEYGVEGALGAWDFQAQNPTISEASVGPGAVRVSWEQNGNRRGLTIRSQLPAWLVAASQGRLRATLGGEPRLDEIEVIGTRVGVVDGPKVEVRMAAYEGVLSVKVTEGRGCWWWNPSTDPWHVPTPKTHDKIPGGDRLLPASLREINAVQGVAPGACLYLRSPIQSGTNVKLIQRLNLGEIGLGEVPGTGLRCAVLAPRRLAAGLVMPCLPVQEASVGRLETLLTRQGYDLLEAQGLAPLLQQLPLVLPLPEQRALLQAEISCQIPLQPRLSLESHGQRTSPPT